MNQDNSGWQQVAVIFILSVVFLIVLFLFIQYGKF